MVAFGLDCTRIAPGESAPCDVIGPKQSFSRLLEEDGALKAYNAIAQTLKVYAVEMRVSPEIVERMMKISPQDVAYLSRQEMASLGVTGIDPVWEDVLISREAKALGISRQEFIQRQAATKTLCGTGLRPFPDTCSDSVMRTGRPSR